MALDSFPLSTVESWFKLQSLKSGSLMVRNADRLDQPARLGTGEVDRQQTVVQVRSQHLHAVRQHEGALELSRRDAAVEILPALVVLLPAADDELILLDRHVE